MKRNQITQIINTTWCPSLIKNRIIEFLNWFVIKVNATKPFVPVIEEVLDSTNTKKIINIDLNVGAGIETVAPFIKKEIEINSIPITDFNVKQNGLYLFANSFHQLPIEQAKEKLKKIAESGNPVVVVEGNNDSLWQIVGMTFFVPLSVLLTTPFVKPFHFSRLIFTYLIPILPIFIVIDGCLALLKLYNPKDLKELTTDINIPHYEWKMGKNDNGRGGKIIYLTGKKTNNN